MQSHHINCASCLVCLAQTMKFSGNDLHRRAEESGRTSGSAETRQVVDRERHWRSGRAGICVDVFLEMPCQTKGSPCAQEGFFFFWESSFSPSVAKALFIRHANPTRFQGRFSTHASAGAHLRRLFLEVSLADEHRPRYGMTGMLFE